MTEVQCVLDCRDKLGEGAFWCPDEQVLYWLDVPMPSVLHRLDPASGRHDGWPMPEMIASMAKRRDGTLLVASQHGLNVFDPASGALKRIAAPEADKPANRANDGAPDARGRFWYGSMANNIAPDNSYFSPGVATGVIWKVEPDLRLIPVAGGIGIGNATAWSPDWKTFYFADTAENAIFAWDFDLDLGALSNRRLFANPEGHGYPDGACIDAEGYLWNARWEGSSVIRFAPDGSIDRIVDLPAERVTSCAFGGPALDTLYVTTSRLHLSDEALARQPQAGGLFAFRPGVAGLPRPRFGG
jgi:sugar lactone lactonase YvrE